MAGIFSEIDSDIKKLRQLKEEIEKVKNSLKSINVNVDINIAKDLEEQLKYITTQYNTLVQKVAEAEGKITLSTKRINDASEKIIKAQNQLSKSTSINQQSKNSNSSTTANNAETGSIQTQAKAYDELASEIDAVMGTRAQNIKRLIEEQNATRLINEEIKKLTKYQSSNSNLSSAQQKRLEQLNNSLLTHKTALSEIRQVLMNNVKIDNAAATSMDALSQSLGRMRTTYRQLTEDERNSTFGKELLSSINQADARIKTLDATIGNHQRNIGNYSSGWNGLSMSIQQVGRELPSLAVGWNTFFLAISNNLPILADELKRARVQYEALKASGQNAVPVWKQVISSIFSWQTALVAGITLLTLYGDKVVDWVGNLLKGKKALSETYQATKEFQESVSKSSGKILATIEKLSQGWAKLGHDINAKKKFILDYKDAFDSTGIAINNVADAENLLVKDKDVFIKAITEKAQAVAVMDLASKEYEKYIQKILEADAKAEKGVSFGDRIKSWLARSFASEDLSGTLQKEDLSPEAFAKQAEANLRTNAEEHKDEMLKLIKKALGIDEESNKEIEKAGGKAKDTMVANSIRAIEAAISLKREKLKDVDNPNEYKRIMAEIKAEQDKLNAITGGGESITRQASELNQKILSFQLSLEQDRLKIMKDGKKKRLEESRLEWEEQKAKINEEYRQIQEAAKKLNKPLSVQVTNAYNEKLAINDETKKVRDKQIEEDYIKEVKEQEQALTSFMLTEEKKRKAAIKSRYDNIREWAKTQKEGGNMSEEEYSAFTLKIDTAEQAEALKAERDAMNQYLKEYGTFMEKKEAIIKEYNDKIAEATTEGDRKILQKQMEENLKNLNFDEFKLSINFADVFGNLDAQATDALRKLRDKLKEYINSAAKDLGPEDLKELQDAFNNIDLKISERDPFGEFKNSLSSYKSAQKDVKKAQEDLNTVMKGGEIITGGYIDETGKFVTKLLSQEQAEKNLEKAQSSRQKTLEGLTATINAMGNTGMEVVNSGNQVIDMLETFGVEVSDSVKTTLDGVGQIMSGMASINLQNPMSIITGSITMLTGLGKAIAGIFGVGNKDKKLEKEIQSLQSQVEDLQDAYDKLDKAIAKAYSNSAADLIRDQETVLKQQKALVEQKIAKELDKKKTDDDKVDEYRKQLDAINESLGSIEDRVIEAIMGTSVQEAIDQFADAYVNAWSQGEDAAMNAKNVVANILKQSITQSVKDYLKNPVNELMNYLQGAISDGLDEAEKNAIAERVKLMTSGLEKVEDVWAPLFDEIERIQQPDKGGFETMSQDTATELNGRFTALQYAGEVVAAQSKEQTSILNQVFNVSTQHLNIADEIRNSLIDSYFDLVTIRDNTTNTVKRLDDTNKKLDMVNDNLRKLWK